MIQIVEDDLVTCHIIAALLQRMHYTFCEAHSGKEAIEQLNTKPIDLVIADMMLPDMHGLSLLEYKYNQPHLRDIPVLCCTAQADIDTVEAAMGFGAIDFVKKPISVQSFAGRVNRAMERAPVRWESWRAMSRRLQIQTFAMTPMLTIAQQVLRELSDALAEADKGSLPRPALDAIVARAHGAALNVGALRTAHQISTLWSGAADGDVAGEIAALRAALVIELASFDEAIQARAAQGETSGETQGGTQGETPSAAQRDPRRDTPSATPDDTPPAEMAP